MKTTQKLKQQIFKQVQSSGIFKQLQSKLKTQVLSLVQKQSNPNKKHLGFQYQHPLLSKLRKYPLTSLCIDLIQEFLQAFKFKKEINKEQNMRRVDLAGCFNVNIKNKEEKAVLLALVTQLVSGDIQVDITKKNNPFIKQKVQQVQRQPHHFINQKSINQPAKQDDAKTKFNPKKTSENGFFNQQLKPSVSQTISNPSQSTSQPQQDLSRTSKPTSSILSQLQTSPQPSKIQPVVQVKDQKGKKSKKKKEVEKPPEGATDLMGDLMGKFKTKDAKAEEDKKNKIFEQKRAFSQQKAKKVVDPSQSGTNKIRGISTGKISSFASKFMNQSSQPAKNQSFIQQQLDQLQQSKDSTRKNPLYSSTQSGFDKSGYYDRSVDSNAMDDFQYVENAKKFNKKF